MKYTQHKCSCLYANTKVTNLNINKRLSKQSKRRWFETPSRSLWRHCNETILFWDWTVPGKRSILLLMPWLTAPPSHQQPLYWQCRKSVCLSSTRKPHCHMTIDIWLTELRILTTNRSSLCELSVIYQSTKWIWIVIRVTNLLTPFALITV